MKQKNFENQEKEFIELADEYGVRDNYLFVTTLEMYRTQMDVLGKLQKALDEEEILVVKEYVKGRKNLYPNPAVSEYNKTADASHKTASTLMRIIKTMGVESSSDDDSLMELINAE